jgi:uncharacterized protein involved in cysteine biosynthesis
MSVLRALARLRWLIAIAVLIIAWYIHPGLGFTVTLLLLCAAPFDYAMSRHPAGSGKARQARRDAVKQASQRL